MFNKEIFVSKEISNNTQHLENYLFLVIIEYNQSNDTGIVML